MGESGHGNRRRVVGHDTASSSATLAQFMAAIQQGG
jgi:hypothetical protein